MISQVGYLQVVVPPNILDIDSTPSSVAVRENQNINMTCRADGRWGRDLSESSLLLTIIC